MMNKCLPGFHDVIRSLDAKFESDEDHRPTTDETKAYLKKMKASVKALHERLFVVLTAQAKGWAFARQLDFYQTGEEILLDNLRV